MDNKEKSKALLRVEDIYLSFELVQAVNGVSINFNRGEITSLIGPNGAGKTCVLNSINGFYKPQKGRIFLEEKNIMEVASHEISKLGISRTFQLGELYAGLSTIDNIMSARHNQLKYGILSGALFFGRARREEVYHRKIVEEIIDFLELGPIRNKIVGTLPFGMRKRVELGRALAAKPKIILLDEPMSGMNLEEKEDMARFILDIYEDMEIPIVLIEHDMEVIMDISHRIVVMNFGKVIAEGLPEEIKTNSEVINAYLGD